VILAKSVIMGPATAVFSFIYAWYFLLRSLSPYRCAHYLFVKTNSTGIQEQIIFLQKENESGERMMLSALAFAWVI
jgi:hypothetical protein